MANYLKLCPIFLLYEQFHLRLTRVQLDLEPCLVVTVFNRSILVQDGEVLECAELACLVEGVLRVRAVLSVDIADFEIGNRTHLDQAERAVIELSAIQVGIIRSFLANRILVQELGDLSQTYLR